MGKINKRKQNNLPCRVPDDFLFNKTTIKIKERDSILKRFNIVERDRCKPMNYTNH